MRIPFTCRARLACSLVLALTVSSARAQCAGQWLGGSAGLDGPPLSMRLWDPDGAGPSPARVVAGGVFGAAGGSAAGNIARWNGQAWQAVGTGTNGVVGALETWNGALVAGGAFSECDGQAAENVAIFTGGAWHPLGSITTQVSALCAHGGVLFAGCEGGLRAWNGGAWVPSAGVVNGPVYALESFGGNLYVGGDFTLAGGVSSRSIARWDGSWHAMSGVNGIVRAISQHEATAHIGGSFTLQGEPGGNVASWDGSAWHIVGAGLNDTLYALRSSGSAPGSALWAGGYFTMSGGTLVGYLARWDGAAWQSPGGGVENAAYALCVSGDEVFAGGAFLLAGGGPSPWTARWSSEGVPEILQQPQPASISAGDGVTMSVVLSPGYASAGLAWTLNGTALQDGTTSWGSVVQGSATVTLTISLAGPADAGVYTCMITTPCGSVQSQGAMLSVLGGSACDSIDFNQDGLFPDTLDIDDFLSVFSGGACSNDPQCADIDYNNDGLFPDTLDIDSILSVFSGGACL